jgi:hypothetical protein
MLARMLEDSRLIKAPQEGAVRPETMTRLAVSLTLVLLATAASGGVDVGKQQADWVSSGSLALVAPDASRALAEDSWDPRDQRDRVAAVVDLRLGANGLWIGTAGLDFLVPGQTPPGTWTLEEVADGTLRLLANDRVGTSGGGCWSSGRRTVADVVVVRPRGDHWSASFCGARYPVVEFEGREARDDRWQAAQVERITAGTQVVPGDCSLRSVACEPDHLIARCGGAWVLPSGASRTVAGPDVPAAACGRGRLRDTGFEVPDPCSQTGAGSWCGPPALPSAGQLPAPEPARPFVRWCEQTPSWAGPGLHPPYARGRPHGAMLACWRRALERDPGACGEVTALVARPLVLGGSTQVGGVSSTIEDPDLTDCVARALQEWAPPGPPDGGEVPIRAVLRSPSATVPAASQVSVDGG